MATNQGYSGNVVRDGEGRGVALLSHARVEKVPNREAAHEIAARIWPGKQAEGSARIIKSDMTGRTFIVDVLHAAPVQQCAQDLRQAVAAALMIDESRVETWSTAGVLCGNQHKNPGSPRRGTRHQTAPESGYAHR